MEETEFGVEQKASNEDRRIKIGNMSALKKCAKYASSSMWGVQELLARGVLMCAWFWANFLLEQRELIFQDMLKVKCSHS